MEWIGWVDRSASIIRHPKIFFFDVGVLNGLLNNFVVSADRKGMLLEHLVYNQIRNSALAQDKDIEIFFFRTRHGLEVDFIVRLDNKIWAIEVKSGAVSKNELSGLIAFREYYPKVHGCIAVSPEERRRVSNGILICGVAELLKEMKL